MRSARRRSLGLGFVDGVAAAIGATFYCFSGTVIIFVPRRGGQICLPPSLDASWDPSPALLAFRGAFGTCREAGHVAFDDRVELSWTSLCLRAGVRREPERDDADGWRNRVAQVRNDALLLATGDADGVLRYVEAEDESGV